MQTRDTKMLLDIAFLYCLLKHVLCHELKAVMSMSMLSRESVFRKTRSGPYLVFAFQRLIRRR